MPHHMWGGGLILELFWFQKRLNSLEKFSISVDTYPSFGTENEPLFNIYIIYYVVN